MRLRFYFQFSGRQFWLASYACGYIKEKAQLYVNRGHVLLKKQWPLCMYSRQGEKYQLEVLVSFYVSVMSPICLSISAKSRNTVLKIFFVIVDIS